MAGWNIDFLLGWPIFRCYVSFRECIPIYTKISKTPNLAPQLTLRITGTFVETMSQQALGGFGNFHPAERPWRIPTCLGGGYKLYPPSWMAEHTMGKLGEKPTLLIGSYRWQPQRFFFEIFSSRSQDDPILWAYFFKWIWWKKPQLVFLGVGWK